ncbi:hypothetical protein OIV83_000888 [Microbotryomycetes sp. JL201]|nr:hypothetical protein OIV83_000888 [Microbotryomycetes sp. JL201]
MAVFRAGAPNWPYRAAGVVDALNRQNCYTIRVGGHNTNLQSTTAERSKRARIAPEPSLEELAAANDDDLELYDQAFPDNFFPHFEQGSLEKRQVVKNCTGTGTPGNGTEPPPPPSPRQRVELLSWPGATTGTWKYTWKTRQATTSSGYKFNHIWQILRRDACGGAVVTLDLINNNVVIRDNVRKCPSTGCASISASSWFGKTISHTMIIKFGVNGSINYSAVEAGKVSPSLIKYHATGDMGYKTSLKSGIYRASETGMLPAQMWIGQWVATKIA